MKFTYVTLFPSLIKGYFEDSILKKAREKSLIDLHFINPREYTTNKHRKVDDYAISGGAGLTMYAQPLFDLLLEIKSESPNARIIFPVPAGKPFRQNDAVRLSKEDELIFVCGRYEGIDERVIETFADELFSIGDYILTGGELPAVVMSDAISRNIPEVLGNHESLTEESFNASLLEAPTFTKPALFNDLGVPSELLKGNHSKISALKYSLAVAKTQFFRPDLFRNEKTERKR